MRNNSLTRLLALAAFIVVLSAGVMSAALETPVPPTPSLTGIKVSFKLDPRVTRGMYMGDLWVSPPTFIQVGLPDVKEISVEARCEGFDAKGMPLVITPQWAPSDPGMVTVSPGLGNNVIITVHSAGQSVLNVTAQGFTRKLTVIAKYVVNTLQVDISQ